MEYYSREYLESNGWIYHEDRFYHCRSPYQFCLERASDFQKYLEVKELEESTITNKILFVVAFIVTMSWQIPFFLILSPFLFVTWCYHRVRGN
jgi:hypothetical protein